MGLTDHFTMTELTASIVAERKGINNTAPDSLMPHLFILAVGFDQLANAAFGGDEDETISSRCWRYRAEPHYSALVQIVNFLFGDSNHCQDSFEDEARKRKMILPC